MGKANISFPSGMLEEIDERADVTGTTRSGFVQEAVATYLARLDHETERELHGARIERAIAGMREIGRTLALGPDGATLVRRAREEVPAWLDEKSLGDDE